MEYEAVIGLETHVQLKTKSKMWCGCANQYGSEPNTNVCPVCLGMPGVLPVPNEEALRKTVLTGYLLNCEIPRFAKFDRKNYFYPDASKNYQLTQYDKPSTANGFVEFEFDGAGSVNGLGKVRITRAHLEEDVGKLTELLESSCTLPPASHASTAVNAWMCRTIFGPKLFPGGVGRTRLIS